jgi:hypothetical protein
VAHRTRTAAISLSLVISRGGLNFHLKFKRYVDLLRSYTAMRLTIDAL